VIDLLVNIPYSHVVAAGQGAARRGSARFGVGANGTNCGNGLPKGGTKQS
jgi:hypothetical protein